MALNNPPLPAPEPIGSLGPIRKAATLHFNTYRALIKQLNYRHGNDGADILLGRVRSAFADMSEESTQRQGLILSAVRSAFDLSQAAIDLVDRYDGELNVKREIEKKLREDERDAAWLNWAQRSIRWAASAFLVLMLYSGAVEISQRWTFVHVPIHDWIPKKITEG